MSCSSSSSASRAGTLFFKPLCANLNRNTRLILEMNPFVVFKYNNLKTRTSVCFDGGVEPHWDDAIQIEVEDRGYITVEIWDKASVTPNKLIGSCLISVEGTIVMQREDQKILELNYKGKYAGKLLLSYSFKGESI